MVVLYCKMYSMFRMYYVVIFQMFFSGADGSSVHTVHIHTAVPALSSQAGTESRMGIQKAKAKGLVLLVMFRRIMRQLN